ncbi:MULTISPECIES: hypothetical protein [Flavobacterium]|jgi:hypothetical protein|uniref:Uncharacterized protein n=2 Tax=Flavobacterium johnsoniae TaxID=986 RepID=A0A1M6R1M9_FLAJO|nr:MULTISPECIES: hypothetical protein [Flavobacterium]ABQ04568.1 hypothetical protein Fjoh_1536 [Flavobacterium johnsoniae UW101]OXE97890.1 hypothetical protein B0A63_17325 [Flavobacterium johnsoniae UW101]WDF60282.1 hypothetical protein PQ462_02670 [Flavobacterium sp. KACC 22758]WQG83636.1 hypothetical protein SR927_11060 [Flavobacterium johnsoniae UW101]SHG02717.1 hypothetical protein SAMN05444388_101399 [Flavobacterium johnsoniae]
MSEGNSNFDEFEKKNDKSQQDLSTGLKVLSFCIPLAGAIIYFVKKNDEPVAAKSACNMALIGFAVGIVVRIIQYATAGV